MRNAWKSARHLIECDVASRNSYTRTAHFGGVRVETSCCANGRHYNHLVDQPCNGAASRRVFAALGVSLASLLFLL